jgi:hypothetical protein
MILQRTARLLTILIVILFCAVAWAADTPPAPAAPPVSSVQTVEPNVAEAILGSRVIGLQGKDIGRLVDVLVDNSGHPQAAVIDFGGFMGVGNRKVAVHWSTLHFDPSDGKHQVQLDMTPDQIKAAPEYSNPDKPAPVVTPADTTTQSQTQPQTQSH